MHRQPKLTIPYRVCMQVLETLSTDLAQRVLRASPAPLAQQLPLLTNRLHPFAIHAACELPTDIHLELDCARHPVPALIEALNLFSKLPGDNSRQHCLQKLFLCSDKELKKKKPSEVLRVEVLVRLSLIHISEPTRPY